MERHSVVFKYINISDEEITNVLSSIDRLVSKLYEIEEKGKEVSNVYRHGPCSHVL
jgi:hypothetical protein